MKSPFFSIVIPTRNRHETLPYALRTCVDQIDFDDYEVIISDNSDDRTASYEAVKPYLNEKVRYVYPPHIMAMTDHWEFALQHVQGEYVTYLGDDDGLSQDALKTYYTCIKQTKSLAVTSLLCIYFWPDAFKTKTNNIVFPLIRRISCSNPKTENSMYQEFYAEDALKELMMFKVLHFEPPCIYSSFISFSLIRRIKEKCGRFFDSSAPDVYSSIVLSTELDKFVTINAFLRILGQSSKSNGAACLEENNAEIKQDFFKLNVKGDFQYISNYTSLDVFSSAIMESAFCAKFNGVEVEVYFDIFFERALRESFVLQSKKKFICNVMKLLLLAQRQGYLLVYIKTVMTLFVLYLQKMFKKNMNEHPDQNIIWNGDVLGFSNVYELSSFIIKNSTFEFTQQANSLNTSREVQVMKE